MSEWRTAGKVRMTPRGTYDPTVVYEILDIVSDDSSTISYIAKKNVPAGTALTNTEYWDVIVDVSAAACPVEGGTYAGSVQTKSFEIDNTTIVQTAEGAASFAEGYDTYADGFASHAEGESTKALGGDSHTEGINTVTTGNGSHAEGSGGIAIGAASHVEGSSTNLNCLINGSANVTTYTVSNVTMSNIILGSPVLVPSINKVATISAINITNNTITVSPTFGTALVNAPAIIFKAYALGQGSHSEGVMNIATLQSSHAEGNSSIAAGVAAHAEGVNTMSVGAGTHSEGTATVAKGNYAHSEGNNTIAYGANSHTENQGEVYFLSVTGTANATIYSYTGSRDPAVGDVVNRQQYYGKITAVDAVNKTFTVDSTLHYQLSSHSLTFYCSGAFGTNSHVEGKGTTALSSEQHVHGKYNVPDSNNTYVEIVGNGIDHEDRSNASTLDWEGNEYLAGDVYVGCGDDSTGGVKLVKTSEISENVYTKSTNLYDPTNDTLGMIIGSDGAENENAQWKTSDYIPYPGGYITMTAASAYQVADGAGFVAWYDSNKTFVTRSQAYGAVGGAKTFSRNDSAYYRICSALETKDVMVNVGQTLSSYIPYGIVCSEPMAAEIQRMIEKYDRSSGSFVWSSNRIPDEGEITTDYQGIATYSPTLSQLYDLYDALVTAYPDYITKTDLGTDQSDTYHIYSYSFKPETAYISNTNFVMPNKPKIMMCSGVHGNGQYGDKPEMVAGMYYFFKNLCDNWEDDDALTYMRWNVQFEVIPVQNPWGYVNQDRKNSRGVDINRNFPYGWRTGVSGERDYGGTAALSEAESVIIKDFIEDNLDAIAFLDVHAVGGTPDQDKMIYFDQLPNNNMSVIANDVIIQLSKKWNSENIGGLTNIRFHGYIDDDGPLGKTAQWVDRICGIPACVFEGFPSFSSSTETYEGDTIMRMCLDEIITVLLKTLSFFKHYKAECNHIQ